MKPIIARLPVEALKTLSKGGASRNAKAYNRNKAKAETRREVKSWSK